jgi:nitrate reductase NapD
MHIAGVLVQTHPDFIAALNARLGDVAGLEVHAINPDGRFVVTVEGAGRKQVADTLARLHTLDGVLSACLVYEHSDSENTEAS